MTHLHANREAFELQDINSKINAHSPGMSIVKIHDNHSFTPGLHRHNFYELFICTQGTGKHILDFKTYDIQPKSIHFIRPGQLHSISMTPPFNGYFIMFHPEFLLTYSPLCRPDNMTCFLHALPIYMTSSNQFEGFIAYVRDLFNLYSPVESLPHMPAPFPSSSSSSSPSSSPSPSSSSSQQSNDSTLLECACLLTLILTQLEKKLEIQPTAPTPSQTTLSFQFLKLLSSTVPPMPTVLDYAKTMNINPNFLNNVVKKETGKTAGSWISDHRLLEAKRLLANTTYSISHIAHLLKFSEASAFCRFFKKQASMTPHQFRTHVN